MWKILKIKFIIPIGILITVVGLPMSYGNDKALNRLKEGNERFQKGKHVNITEGKLRRKPLAQGQNPFAAILACSRRV